MLYPPGSGGIHGYAVTKTYYSSPGYNPSGNTTANPNYDSSSFTKVTNSKSRFMDLVSRLSHEVRTSTTTGKIQELRQAVSTGEYKPDPAEIAKRLMLLTED